MVDIIRRITVEAKATGVAPVVAELNTLTAAQKRLGDTSEETSAKTTEAGGATLAVANKFRALRYSLDEAWRATEKFKQAENTLKLAVEQGAATKDEARRLTELLTSKYNANTIAANKNAEAIRAQAGAYRTLAGAQAASGGISFRKMDQPEALPPPASRTFTPGVIAGAPGVVGGITTRAMGGGKPEDIGKMSSQMRELGQNTRLTSFEMANLGFQINDIAVMAASGQNPFTLIMQQGMQIAQIMTMSAVATMGLKASMAALGSALVTFIMQPINQVIVGLALAAGALMLFFNSLRSESVDAETALKTHEDLLEKIKERYGEAAVAAIKFHEAASGQGLAFKAQTNVLSAEAGARTALGAAAGGMGDIQEQFKLGLFEGEGVKAEFVGLNALIEEFKKDAEDGVVVTQDWIDKFVALGTIAPADVRATTVEVLALIEATEDANRVFEEARRARAVAEQDVERMARGDATLFAGQAPGVAAGFRTKDVHDAAEEAIRLAGALETAERAARASATGFDASFETTKEAVKDAAVAMVGSLETAERAARASATGFEQSFERVRKAVQDAAIELVGFMETAERAGRASARGFEKGLEDLLKKQADEAERAADEEARRREQEADAAKREAERKQELIEQLRFEHEIMDQLEEDQQVAIRLRELGADATAAQKEEVEALTRSMEQYKQAVKDAEEADKAALKAWEDARDAAIEKMDEFRDSAKGILSAFIEGGPTAALEAFASRLATLGEDLVISGLFGEQGQAGGGLFGDMIQNLLGPIGEKPVATMNVVAGVVNVGGTGAFITGAAPAGGVVPGGMGAMPGGVGTGGPGQSGMIAGVPVDTWAQEATAAAQRAGIDPATFLAVLRSEGLQGGTWQSNVYKNGVRETSYGPGQFLVGGGLGDAFQKQTGLNLANQAAFADPVARQQYLDFMTAQARQTGWSPWYGAANTGIGKWQGIDQNAPLATASTTAAPAVDELATSISGLNNPISTAVPALQNLANTILNFSPGGIPISSQAASAITSGFGGFWAEGGTLGAGKWGIAGEAGPEIIHGPASITPMQRGGASKFNVNIKTQEGVTARVTSAQQNEEGDFDLEIFAEALERRVRDKYGLRQQVSRWGRA